ncbi:MAG: GNAT family N-acetyltransferase [Legionellales bacterium]
MYLTKELAAQLERCLMQSHIEVTKQYSHGAMLEVGGGVACFSGFDSYLSQVVGWGFDTKQRHFLTEIKAIEYFYKELNHTRIDIELCPFVGNQLAVFLSQRGYGVSELSNISALDLINYKQIDFLTHDFTIKEMQSNELELWAKTVAVGFGYPEAQEQFFHYASATGITAFGAYDRGVLVAGATVAMHGGVCDLGVASTLHAFRGKGVHKMLLMARLNFAKQQGLELASVTTAPGTVSDLNIQKMGFRCAYTRIKFTSEIVYP